MRSALAGAIASARSESAAATAGVKSELLAAIATAKVWAPLLYLALATGTFGTMARAFGWI